MPFHLEIAKPKRHTVPLMAVVSLGLHEILTDVHRSSGMCKSVQKSMFSVLNNAHA